MKITTSMSLPASLVAIWRRNRAQILRLTGGLLQQASRRHPRRSVARMYNRGMGAMEIVTARFSAEEYDSLHYLAATLRVSVSLLVFELIQFWLNSGEKPKRKLPLTNYSYSIREWGPTRLIFTEILEIQRTKPYSAPKNA